jgi:endonuclease/exonuclease/phosphatase family metal-dependent hydrolase
MKRLALIIFFLILLSPLYSQNFENLKFGTDSTFEIMTWNIQNFPKNNPVTLNHVTQIIKIMDVDIIAVQEIADSNAFKVLLDSLSDYGGYLGSIYFIGLAYIYKKEVVQINDIYEIYNTFPYWKPFPRAPLLADIKYKGERMIIINNHFKCCGDGIIDHDNPDDEETRRYQATNLLKAYADSLFFDTKVIIIGDLNDIITKESANNVFQNILNDSVHYQFADYEIAFGPVTEWSYPDWPAHIDHIIINHPLFDAFKNVQSEIQTIKIEESYNNGWSDYFQNISDHRPLALKLYFNKNQNASVYQYTKQNPGLIIYPNPFNSETNIHFNLKMENAELHILNIFGQIVFSEKLKAEQTKLTWKAERFAKGIYFVTLKEGGTYCTPLKLILN